MHILSASVTNFASYERLDFNFEDRGLTLVSGPTGSGKSTLCDIIPWVLFGRTAKDGAVDEVRAWDTDEDTTGTIIVRYNVVITVVRTRGKSNDLYFSVDGIGPQRGKDLNDTQRLINSVLGITYETYLTSVYLHEFSQLSSFFTTTAKVRRQITEQMVDLSMAKKLAAASIDYKKDVKQEINDLRRQKDLKANDYTNAIKLKQNEQKRLSEWTTTQAQTIVHLTDKLNAFEADKQKAVAKIEAKLLAFEEDRARQVLDHAHNIKEMTNTLVPQAEIDFQRHALIAHKNHLGPGVCTECGAQKNHAQQMVLTKASYELDNLEAQNKRLEIQIKTTQAAHNRQIKAVNPYIEQRALEESKVNTYLDQVNNAKIQINPYEASLEAAKEQCDILHIEVAILSADLENAQVAADDVDTLTSILDDFRTTLVKNTIVELEQRTNDLLTRHFDAEIRVAFEPDNADKLDVTIYKDGNQCAYTQLSKGQRQLLKLCFGVSAMRITSNHNQTTFNCMFFDEALSGLDSKLKRQAFNLFDALKLECESIFVVEHDQEFQELFANKLVVSLENGHSVING